MQRYKKKNEITKDLVQKCWKMQKIGEKISSLSTEFLKIFILCNSCSPIYNAKLSVCYYPMVSGCKHRSAEGCLPGQEISVGKKYICCQSKMCRVNLTPTFVKALLRCAVNRLTSMR